MAATKEAETMFIKVEPIWLLDRIYQDLAMIGFGILSHRTFYMINGKVRDESFLFIQIRGSSDIVY
jgi:hypothetical protein